MMRACLVILGLLFLPPAPAAVAQLVINEVVSANRTGLRDDLGDHSDWIELFNPGSVAVPLANWSLSDDPRRPRRWSFRSGEIGPGGFLVVFATGEDRQPTPTLPVEPEQVPGLVLRLRADAIDRNDAAQIRAEGTRRFVRRWADLQHRTGDAAQENPALQPLLGVANGRAVVRFDGTDDLLRLAAPPGTNNFTLIAVALPAAAHQVDAESAAGVEGVDGQRWLFGAAHGGDAGAGAGLSVGTNGAGLYEHGSAYMPARCVYAGDLSGAPAVLSMVYSNRQPSLAVGGTVVRSAGVSGRNPVTAPVEIGSGAYGAFAGDVLEILAWNRALDGTERASIEAGLADRYGARLLRTWHAGFRLDADGESLTLTRPDGTIADVLDLPAEPPDLSYGRQPDGSATLRHFPTPTPGGPNVTPGGSAILRAPVPSHPAGFHTATFQLTFTSPDPDAEIRYTLDGSEPTTNSPLHLAPLAITNRATAPNRLSIIPTAPGWSPPGGIVFKGTVVRARAFRTDALPSDITTASYFVHPKGRDRYPLPVVALSTDPRNLFDADVGIYVPGNAAGGNYAQTGDAWERPVHVELLETNGVRTLAQEAGLRIHGNTSFNFPIKALRLHALNQHGTGPFRARVFPNLPIESFDRLLLRPSGHDYYLTMMRDGLMQAIVRELGMDQQAYRPAILFVNGEFWGIHNLQEAFEKHYFANHHPEVDPDAVDYLEGYPPDTFAYEGDASRFNDLFRSLGSLPLETEAGLAAVAEQMEIANYRDYKLTEIFHYRWDIGNHRLWRPHTETGRLRWILFDFDVGYGGFWSVAQPWSFNMLQSVLEPTGTLNGHNNATTTHLLTQLLRNDGFRRDFINRAADLMNTTFDSDRMVGFIDRMAAEIAPVMVEHITRWRAPATWSDWQTNVESLRTFARRRPEFMRQHLRERFKLRGNVTLRLAPPPPGAGTLSLNSLDPVPFPGASNVWTGLYFRDNPIRLTARPAAGWRFAGWTGLPGITDKSVTLTLNEDFRTAARFVPDAPLTIGRIVRTGASRLQLELNGTALAPVALEVSPDLTVWREVTRTNLDATGSASAQIPIDAARGFLRARLVTPAARP